MSPFQHAVVSPGVIVVATNGFALVPTAIVTAAGGVALALGAIVAASGIALVSSATVAAAGAAALVPGATAVAANGIALVPGAQGVAAGGIEPLLQPGVQEHVCKDVVGSSSESPRPTSAHENSDMDEARYWAQAQATCHLSQNGYGFSE